MKSKQKKEIEHLLICETKVEKIKRENDQKDYNEKIREEQIVRNIFEKQKKIEESNLKKEKYKQDLFKIDINEQQSRNLSRFLETQKTKNYENNQDDDEKMKENYMIQEGRNIRHTYSIESNLLEQQKKTMERQRMMKERDKIRKESIIQMQVETKIDSLKFKEFTQRKIAFAKNQFEVKIMHQKQVFIN